MMQKTQQNTEKVKVETMHKTYIKCRESESGNDALDIHKIQRKWK